MEHKIMSLEERKQVQLEMLLELDAFCRKNKIKYMLAYGTLIGAIRHKGFIPWDDDVDIIMPYEDMLYLKKHLHSDNIEVVDVTSKSYYYLPFPRIAHKGSFSKIGKKAEANGVSIDLYVMIPCTNNSKDQDNIIKALKPYSSVWTFMYRTYLRMLRDFPINRLYGFSWINRLYAKKIVEKMYNRGGGNYFCISGPLKTYKNETFAYNMFEELIDVEFEGHKFLAPSCYDNFLTQCYGDYMTPPPVEKQVPYHGGDYYWK